MKTLEELKEELLADGIIDADEVKELEEVLYEDGMIDKDEADFLFELNNAVSGKQNAHEWKDFFVKALTSFVLDDDKSNGEVDDDEAKYLYDQIKGDGQIDDIEKALLENIKAKSNNFPALLETLLQ
ncbi:MAG: TerB family tellurite resistance protein [Prevotella sp.]|nr:TerB family tellurite resistance protein [Prevotella sp.]